VTDHGRDAFRPGVTDRRARDYRRSGPPLGANLRTTAASLQIRVAGATRTVISPTTLLRRPVEPGQYVSFDYTQTLTDHRVLQSVGSVGDAYDNALAESFVDSFKTELIADRVWCTRAQLELATVEYIGWFNHDRPPQRARLPDPGRTRSPVARTLAARTAHG
jgi:putative transposase